MRHPSYALAVVATLALPVTALAGPSQGSITLPGGYGSACASQVSNSTLLPGTDITAAFAGFAGRYACQSQVFSGAAGVASASAAWAAPDLANQAAIRVGMGSIGFSARNDAPGGYTYQGPVGVASGGWADRLQVDLAGHEGQAAVWRFTVQVEGEMLNQQWGRTHLELSAFKDHGELRNNVPGYDRGGSDPRTTDLQRVAWDASYGADRSLQDRVTFAVPVTIGQAFDWGVFATLQAGASSYGPTLARSIAQADFGDTVAYGGSAGLYIGDQLMQGWSMQSASGLDWLAAPVPEPASALLMMLGGAALLAARRQRAG